LLSIYWRLEAGDLSSPNRLFTRLRAMFVGAFLRDRSLR